MWPLCRNRTRPPEPPPLVPIFGRAMQQLFPSPPVERKGGCPLRRARGGYGVFHLSHWTSLCVPGTVISSRLLVVGSGLARNATSALRGRMVPLAAAESTTMASAEAQQKGAQEKVCYLRVELPTVSAERSCWCCVCVGGGGETRTSRPEICPSLCVPCGRVRGECCALMSRCWHVGMCTFRAWRPFHACCV